MIIYLYTYRLIDAYSPTKLPMAEAKALEVAKAAARDIAEAMAQKKAGDGHLGGLKWGDFSWIFWGFGYVERFVDLMIF